MSKIRKSDMYRIEFVRRPTDDDYWMLGLTPKASFSKVFKTIEEAAKFIANNVYLTYPFDNSVVNEHSGIVMWSMDDKIDLRERTIMYNKVNALVKNKHVPHNKKGVLFC